MLAKVLFLEHIQSVFCSIVQSSSTRFVSRDFLTRYSAERMHMALKCENGRGGILAFLDREQYDCETRGARGN